MSMAHPLPGLGNKKVDKHQDLLRAASAPPDVWRLREMLRPMNPKECERIKDNARRGWFDEVERNNRCVTTYNGLHARKILDQPTQHRVRPTSPNRLNKPHPPDVFLVTRLKKVRGCFDPTAVATQKYGGNQREQLEAYVEHNKQKIAKAMGYYRPPQRPRTADVVGLDRTREKITTLMGQVPGQATEAWVKLSNDKDKRVLLGAIDEAAKRRDYLNQVKQREKERRRQRQRYGQGNTSELVFSSNRWLKRAGREEGDAVTKLIEAFRNAPPRQIPTEGPHFHITDYSSMFSSAPKPPYYDFQIHPEWHMPWHKQYEKRKMSMASA